MYRGIISSLFRMQGVPSAKRFCSTHQSINSVKRIAVEGNIATGKSTFLNIIENHSPSFRVIAEPITRWTNVPLDDEICTGSQHFGGNLLDLFYREPKRWAYTFQTYACLSRLRAQLRPPPEEIKSVPNAVLFYERSVFSDKFCFAQNCHESGLFNDTEWSVYCDWHSFLLEALPLQFDGFVYLQASPKVSLERLHKRNRLEERDITLEYLDSLHKKHERWLAQRTVKPPLSVQREVPILVLDCEEEFEENQERQDDLLKQVISFIDSIVDT